MNNEQKLESLIAHYRQLLADEQLKVATLTVELRGAEQTIDALQDELEGYVQKEE